MGIQFQVQAIGLVTVTATVLENDATLSVDGVGRFIIKNFIGADALVITPEHNITAETGGFVLNQFQPVGTEITGASRCRRPIADGPTCGRGVDTLDYFLVFGTQAEIGDNQSCCISSQ